jgi:hypothetical protein
MRYAGIVAALPFLRRERYRTLSQRRLGTRPLPVMGKTLREPIERVQCQKTCRVNFDSRRRCGPHLVHLSLDLVRPNGERIVHSGECQPRRRNRDYSGSIVWADSSFRNLQKRQGACSVIFQRQPPFFDLPNRGGLFCGLLGALLVLNAACYDGPFGRHLSQYDSRFSTAYRPRNSQTMFSLCDVFISLGHSIPFPHESIPVGRRHFHHISHLRVCAKLHTSNPAALRSKTSHWGVTPYRQCRQAGEESSFTVSRPTGRAA